MATVLFSARAEMQNGREGRCRGAFFSPVLSSPHVVKGQIRWELVLQVCPHVIGLPYTRKNAPFSVVFLLSNATANCCGV